MLYRSRTTQIILYAFLTALLIADILVGYKVYQFSELKKEYQHDYAEVNSITYGFFSVDVWKERMVAIFHRRIGDFKFNDNQCKLLETEVASILNAVIFKADSIIQHEDKTFTGKVRRLAYNFFVNPHKVKERVPEFARKIVTELNKPANFEKIRSIAHQKVEEYGEITHSDELYKSQTDSLLNKYRVKSIPVFNAFVNRVQSNLSQQILLYCCVLIGGLFLVLLLWRFVSMDDVLHRIFFLYSIGFSLVVLLVGITSPMIEIDVRIKEFSFSILGEDVAFYDQVIFFQSKSIIDVVILLLKTGKIDSIGVGLLLMIFSVIFPVLKLISSGLFLTNPHLYKENKVVHFMAFKSAKWSMADVMVVAIFMAFIGFRNILDKQLKEVADAGGDTFSIIATNLTALQPGYMVFVAFVLFSLILSTILKNITPK